MTVQSCVLTVLQHESQQIMIQRDASRTYRVDGVNVMDTSAESSVLQQCIGNGSDGTEVHLVKS